MQDPSVSPAVYLEDEDKPSSRDALAGGRQTGNVGGSSAAQYEDKYAERSRRRRKTAGLPLAGMDCTTLPTCALQLSSIPSRKLHVLGRRRFPCLFPFVPLLLSLLSASSLLFSCTYFARCIFRYIT
ncbi:hypothetical protein MSAN_00973400 [Mycena sanguinolenta]|uniref:Transmembrane protein n=1 Tax=Mycena sanguinolenta TaxID=230812 RepID=A0A8H7DBV4_9AGAR|nr:hypothetical protein MSAN_00973400 [Mycena sanguinolenta]